MLPIISISISADSHVTVFFQILPSSFLLRKVARNRAMPQKNVWPRAWTTTSATLPVLVRIWDVQSLAFRYFFLSSCYRLSISSELTSPSFLFSPAWSGRSSKWRNISWPWTSLESMIFDSSSRTAHRDLPNSMTHRNIRIN